MTEYDPYPDDTETEPIRYTGTTWYLVVPETGFDEEITEGDIVHIPPDSHQAFRDLMEPAPAYERDQVAVAVDEDATATDDGTVDYEDEPEPADGDDLDEALDLDDEDEEDEEDEAEPDHEYADQIPPAEELAEYEYQQLRSARKGTPIADKQGAEELEVALNQLREGGVANVDDEYLA